MPEASREDEIKRRRTFAIISHPDAGKTTLTEKLLLYGGAIRQAGSVKSRKAGNYALSDWMEIEKQRGISVTSSVMNFDYEGFRVNILDTPGHQDFSEDAYRTLMAADSAVMLLDGAKGVEEQTKKLFHVCRMRGIPIFTFVNKLDRVCKDPFELMDELEKTLGISSYPVTWPVGSDGIFKGVYNRALQRIEFFDADGSHGAQKLASISVGIDGDELSNIIGEAECAGLREDVALLDEAGERFDLERVRAGTLTPVFFGSAITNFGVQRFLEDFIKMAPHPTGRKSDKGVIEPGNENFSGFIFKIQANMDPRHRDRLAFIRVCSGQYEKGMSVYNTRLGRQVRLAQTQQLLAQDRTEAGEAYAGDIIGIFDSGSLHLGDTLCAESDIFSFEPIPMFPAEHFAAVSAKDAGKRKQFQKGMDQLLVEGAVQVFRSPDYGADRCIVGVAGALQMDVLAYRMSGEYGVELRVEPLNYQFARWITPEDAHPDLPRYSSETITVTDPLGRPVALFDNRWAMQRAMDKNPGIGFLDIAPVRR